VGYGDLNVFFYHWLDWKCNIGAISLMTLECLLMSKTDDDHLLKNHRRESQCRFHSLKSSIQNIKVSLYGVYATFNNISVIS
jgi:hypothetical protein